MPGPDSSRSATETAVQASSSTAVSPGRRGSDRGTPYNARAKPMTNRPGMGPYPRSSAEQQAEHGEEALEDEVLEPGGPVDQVEDLADIDRDDPAQREAPDGVQRLDASLGPVGGVVTFFAGHML